MGPVTDIRRITTHLHSDLRLFHRALCHHSTNPPQCKGTSISTIQIFFAGPSGFIPVFFYKEREDGSRRKDGESP